MSKKVINENNYNVKPSEICIGILTCQKKKKRFKKFMDMFEGKFNELGIKYYVLICNPLLAREGLEYKIVGNYFYIGISDAYETLAHKLVIFYTYIYNHTNYKYIIKTDDGCLINIDKILNFPKGENYIGTRLRPTANSIHKGKCKNGKLNKICLDFTHNFDKIKGIEEDKLKNIKNIEYGGGGYGYGLTRKALSFIPKYKDHILSIPLSYEDVLFGQIMYLSDISFCNYRFGQYHKVK